MYHQKYQKYKLKYLDLKYRFSQHGGTVITNFNQIEDGMTNYYLQWCANFGSWITSK